MHMRVTENENAYARHGRGKSVCGLPTSVAVAVKTSMELKTRTAEKPTFLTRRNPTVDAGSRSFREQTSGEHL